MSSSYCQSIKLTNIYYYSSGVENEQEIQIKYQISNNNKNDEVV
jgi:hypothetical protein